jgi:hypothetical protein
LRTWAPDLGLAGSRILTKAATEGGGSMATQLDLTCLRLRSVAQHETHITVADRLPDDSSDTLAARDPRH